MLRVVRAPGFRGWLVGLGMALVFVVVPALAQRVLIVRPSQRDPILFEAYGRLKAELSLQGFEIIEQREASSPTNPDELELAASRLDAFAAIGLRRDRDGTMAQVHIVDRVTGKTIIRKLKISTAKDGPMLLAIRAADLLRTSLLELGPGERPPEDVVGVEESPPPEQIVRFSRSLPRFQIGAGAMLAFHPEMGLAAGGSVAGNYRPTPRLQVGLEFAGPIFGGRYQGGMGDATIRQEWGMVRGSWNLGEADPGRRWEWGPVLAAGGVHVDARGDVEAPLVSRRASVWAFGLLGGAQVESYFSESASLGLTVAVLGVFPQPAIAVADDHSSPIGVQGVSTLRFGVSF